MIVELASVEGPAIGGSDHGGSIDSKIGGPATCIIGNNRFGGPTKGGPFGSNGCGGTALHSLPLVPADLVVVMVPLEYILLHSI